MLKKEEKEMSPSAEEIRRMEHEHAKMSYNKIEDLIYAGNNMCCRTHFEMELLSKGITAQREFLLKPGKR